MKSQYDDVRCSEAIAGDRSVSGCSFIVTTMHHRYVETVHKNGQLFRWRLTRHGFSLQCFLWDRNPQYWSSLMYACGDIEKNPGPSSVEGSGSTMSAFSDADVVEVNDLLKAFSELEHGVSAILKSSPLKNPRVDRLEQQREFVARKRRCESLEQTLARRKNDREATAAARSLQSHQQRSARRKADKNATAAVRSQESPKQKSVRRRADKDATAAVRSQKSPQQKSVLRKADKDATAFVRSEESAKRKSVRQKADKNATAAVRSQESPKQKSVRRNADKDATAALRSQESARQKYARRKGDKDATAVVRSLQSPQQKSVRRNADKDATAEFRSQESLQVKSARRNADKDATAALRSQESPQQKSARRNLDKDATAALRSQESPQQKSARRNLDKDATAALRSQESPQQESARRNADKDATAAVRSQESPYGRCNRLTKLKVDNQIQRHIRNVVEKDGDAINRRAKVAAVERKRSSSSGRFTATSNASSIGDLDEEAFSAVECHFGNAACRFHESMVNFAFIDCSVCMERTSSMKISGGTCNRCARDKHDIKLFSELNGMDPLTAPSELQGLTQVEELLIAQVRPMMMVYRLPYGQLGYRGNVINFPCDVQSFADSLPPKIGELEFIVVRRKNSTGEIQDFRVRREKVRTALLWLRNNNVYYQTITIDEGNIEALPADDFIQLGSVQVVCEPECSDNADAVVEDIESDVTGVSFVPQQLNCRTERQRAYDALQQSNTDPVIGFPSADMSRPINEFTTEGYVARAFPTLLPYGLADLKAPRQRYVTPLQYFRHMMDYCDGRFAQHPRFRYFALNSVLRWRALSIGNAYVKQNPEDKMITLDELKQMNKIEKEALAKAIFRIGYALPGTRSFWMSKRKELVALIEQLGKLPTVFVTLSAADLHWPELHALMPGYTSKSKAVAENPMVCGRFFQHRVKQLLGTVFKNFGLEDYWGRFEFQHRGSIHFHGLAWFAGAPEVTQLMIDDEPGLRAAVAYFDTLVTAWNPILDDHTRIEDYRIHHNPTSLPLHLVSDVEKDYKDLIVTCQRHTVCSSHTCMKKKDGKIKCRFDFPKDTHEASTIEILRQEDRAAELQFHPRRNDPRINVHNRLLLQVHRANVDMQPIVDKTKVVSYLTKYVSKSEVSSSGLSSVIAALLQGLSEVNPSTRIAQRLLMKSVAERDYSAQETTHILMDQQMVLHSRQIVHLSLRGERRLSIDESVENVTVATEVDKYMQRPAEFSDISLLSFTRHYSRTSKGSIVSRKRDAIVLCHPQLKCDKQSPRYEDACLFHLMKHKPFRRLVDLRGTFPSFAAAYEAFVDQLRPADRFDLTEMMRDYEEDDDFHDAVVNCRDNPKEVPGVQEDWMLISRALDDAPCLPCHISDWLLPIRSNPDYSTAKEFYAARKDMVSSDVRFPIPCQSLNSTQRLIFNVVMSHFEAMGRQASDVLRMVICGTAGTGKSFLIKCLKDNLQSSCVVMAPTGVAALAVDGATIHSVLRIPVGSTFAPLKGDDLTELQMYFRDVHFVIIDEMSMIGHIFFSKIDQRLRQARPECAVEWFGGFSVILIGDFGQLPPVCDKSLFAMPSTAGLRASGALAYRSFNMAAYLQECVRHHGDEKFRQLLLRLRDGATTFADYQLLSSRFKGRVIHDGDFSTSLHLFPTVKLVAEYNFEHLTLLSSPIAKLEADHNCKKAALASTDASGGLAAVIYICKGARVMLTSNIHVQMGLCNGSQGEVVDIVYETGGPPTLPSCVICRFDAYKGCPFLGMEKCFPILPIQRYFEVDGVKCSRRSIPLTLAYSMTVHKAQGLTLDKCVVDIGCKEFTAGLTFVALSRVRRLDDLLLIPFAFDRIKSWSRSVALLARIHEDSRLAAMSHRDFSTSPVLLSDCSAPRPVVTAKPTLSYPIDAVESDAQDVPAADGSLIADVMSFMPLGLSDRQRVAEFLDVRLPSYHHPYGTQRLVSFHTPPAETVAIKGDGNCFYRCISAAIFGLESKYGIIKRFVADVVSQYGDNIPPQMQGVSVDDIRNEAVFATEQAVFATATALQLTIAIYSAYGATERWMIHAPCRHTSSTSDTSHSPSPSIYLRHVNGNHFNLVTALQ